MAYAKQAMGSRVLDLIKSLLLLAVLCTTSQRAMAAEASPPANWPWHGVSIGFPGGSVADIERYKAGLDINSVRLDLVPRWYGMRQGLDGEHALADALAWTDRMLDACARLGIVAVIHMDHFPIDPADQTVSTTPEFWSDSQQLDRIVAVAHRLAVRYGKRGRELAAYHVISEPLVYVAGQAQSPAQLPELQRRIVAAIRSEDRERWIVVSPGPGGQPQSYLQYAAPDDGRLIWGAHMYAPHKFTHQGIAGRPLGVEYPGSVDGAYWDRNELRKLLEPLRQFQRDHPGRVYIGEFSAVRWARGGEQYLRDLVSLFDEYGWGWDYFSATDWHGWNPDYDDEYAPDAPESAWRAHFVGEASKRWTTLRSLFGIYR